MSTHAQPVYFPSGEQTLFGWVHAAGEAPRSDLGVIICNPFGYETVCAYRSLRAFAESCAASGITALRFDYRGTGNSSDSPDPEDQVSAWCADIAAAVEFLQSSTGVRRVCLIGMRLGALLAARVAAGQAIDSLVAIAPVTSGSRYVRELRAFQASIAAAPVAGSAVNTGTAAAVAGQELQEFAGFPMTKASLDTLSRVDAARLTHAAATRTLILDRDDLPGARSWFTALETQGMNVQYQALPGFTGMVSTPHAAVIPTAMLDATMRWLQAQTAGAASTAATVTMPLEPEAGMRIRHDGVELAERAMFFDDDRRLFGIVTEPVNRPDNAVAGTEAVVLLNTGATAHIGPNRIHVELARRWAARGYLVLRFDLAGLGDSATRAGQETNQVYPADALEDVRRAIDFVMHRRPTRHVTLAGVCAGAYHGLRAAISGLPVNTVLCVNPLTFNWKQGSKLEDLQISEVVRNPGVYARNALSARHWAKLARGQVNLWRAVMVFLRRSWLSFEATLRDLCRRLHIHLPNDLGWNLQAVTARGVRVVFFFARQDAGLELLRLEAGSTLKKLGARCPVHVIEGADHIFSQRQTRSQLIELLNAELTRRSAQEPQQSPADGNRRGHCPSFS
jgi:alpha-beta hydrolase superfamily lysophospholipase